MVERSATFDPRRLSGGHGRAPWLVVGWIGVLALVIALGKAGPTPTATGVAVGDGAAGPAASAAEQSLSAEVVAVDLRSPAIGPITVTTRQLRVEGSVLVHAASVLVSLEARNNRLLASVVFDISDPNGGIRPERTPTFSAEFDIPFPRPNGTMWVVVTAYDGHGIPLGGTRRPVRIGELLSG